MWQHRSVRLKLSVIITLLIILNPVSSLAAEIWSEPTQTKQWTEDPDFALPPAPGQSSQPPEAIPWGDPNEWFAPPPAETSQAPAAAAKPSIYIKLQIGSKAARVQDKDTQLAAAPISIDGNTMVPFRFLGDALKAEVGWEQSMKTVTMKLKDKTIKMVVGQSEALINGKSVKLTTPAVIKDGSTLIPLRFVSENLDLFVNYIAATKTIEIADQPFESTAASNSGTSTSPTAPASPINPTIPNVADNSAGSNSDSGVLDYEKLYGTWYIWTASSVTNLYDKTTGNYATHELDAGADQGKVVINKNGTYSMSHGAWDKGTTVEGKWRLTFPNEMTIDKKVSIVLLDGITDVNWNVKIADNGKIQLRYAMDWADGSVTWIHDSELYQK